MASSRPRRGATDRRHYGEDSDASAEASRSSLRNKRSRPNYVVDASSNTDSDSTAPVPEQQRALPHRVTATRPTDRRAPKRKIHATRSKPLTSFKRRKALGAPLKQNHVTQDELLPFMRSGGKTPPWQTLEHSILAEILVHGSYPLYTDYVRPNPSIRWLMGMSRLSKSFREAALSAILYSPPLYPFAPGLAQLLAQDQQSLSSDYRVKIRKLVVEAKYLLVKRGGVLNLGDFVRHCPLLESIRLISHYDELAAIWAHPSVAKKTYVYEQSLYAALQTSCPRLRDFEWNGRFATNISGVIDSMESAVTYSVFTGLSSITLMNLNVPEKTTDEARLALGRRLLVVLNRMPGLKRLKIARCDVLGDFAELATLNTSQLKSLTVTECPRLTSRGLEAFLATKGSHLEGLTLNFCQSLDGAWLPMLPDYCPRLLSLHLDLTYFDASSYGDTEAHYDDFLPEGPLKLPSSLVDICITNLRKIDSSQLEACLQSLVSTPLPSLRRLSLKAILTDPDYRVRARIRNEWRDRLENVFLRRPDPPLWCTEASKALPERQAEEPVPNLKETKHRQSNRLSKPLVSKAPSEGTENTAPTGMCHTVEFRVDDERPAASQFREGDFLDDEASGDGDFDGRIINDDDLWGY